MSKAKEDCRNNWEKDHLTDNLCHNCPICKEQGRKEVEREIADRNSYISKLKDIYKNERLATLEDVDKYLRTKCMGKDKFGFYIILSEKALPWLEQQISDAKKKLKEVDVK